MATVVGCVGEEVAADLERKPRGGRKEVACKTRTGGASAGASNYSGNDLALDSWSYYNTW
jgi:hypothetical protein